MVRTATVEDIPRISEIHVYGWRTAYAGLVSDKVLYKDRTVEKWIAGHRELQPQWQDALVFEQDGIVKGFSFAGASRSEDKKDAWELFAIYVEPVFKFQGVGSALVEKTEELARAKTKTELFLWVLEKNPDGIRFYEKQGFRTDGTHLYDEGLKLDEIRMSKLL